MKNKQSIPSLTWAQLAEIISSLSPLDLSDNVSCLVNGEYIPLVSAHIAHESHGILHEGHLFLAAENDRPDGATEINLENLTN